MTGADVVDPNDDLDVLVAGYFQDLPILAAETARHLAEHSSIERTRPAGNDGRLSRWLTEMLNYGPADGPEQAWPIILTLVARAPNDNALVFIGCGAVEDLVNKAGSAFEDRILAQAMSDARFRAALGCVWPGSGVPAPLRALIRSLPCGSDPFPKRSST